MYRWHKLTVCNLYLCDRLAYPVLTVGLLSLAIVTLIGCLHVEPIYTECLGNLQHFQLGPETCLFTYDS